MENKKEECKNCGKCCRYIATEIDAPETREDFEDLKWYVAHKNVNVFVDDEGDWYIEFLTPCEFLGEDNKCLNYENRPTICRKYDADYCLYNNDDYVEKHTFKTIEDVEKYLEEHSEAIKESEEEVDIHTCPECGCEFCDDEDEEDED